jgi:hypothetical protein
VAPVVVAASPAAAAPAADLDGRPAAVKQPIIVIDNYDSFTYNLCQVYGFCSWPIRIQTPCGTICMWVFFIGDEWQLQGPILI